jgi:histidine triad (HIT) family protein
VKESESCLFCKFASNEIKVSKVYEDESFYCIRDIHPQAKEHLLIIPKNHIESLEGASADLVGRLFSVATQVARKEGLLPGGFRSVINTGPNSGQTVFHLHLHLLGGEVLKNHFA